MKSSFYLLFSIAVFLNSCENDDSISEQDKLASIISGVWDTKSVTLGGENQTEWTDFTLVISKTDDSYWDLIANTYNLPNNVESSVWPASSNLVFSEDLSGMIREDGVEVEFLLEDSLLSMQFKFDPNSGRIVKADSLGPFPVFDWNFLLERAE